MSLLWPRLDDSAARALLDELREMTREELRARAGQSHPAQRFASTGGRRASHDDLRALRSAVTAAAEHFGYPGELADGDRVAFDRRLAPALLTAMPMAVGEALVKSVWNFTSIVVAPDVTEWRFGFRNEERWLCTDRTRHMFSRLWWQASQLGSADGREPQLLAGLSESDLNQLLERTSIGGCRPLVRALAKAVVGLEEHEKQRLVVREASLRVLRLTGVVDPYALSEDQLGALVAGAVRAALASANTAS